MSSNPTYTIIPKISLFQNDTKVSRVSSFISASNVMTESNTISKSNGSLIFEIDGNTKNNYFQQ